MTNFDTNNTPLPRLIDEIMDGRLQLPDFQRSWVWDVDSIISLLNSIARSFPIGAVMLLETGDEGEVQFESRMVEHVRPTNGNSNLERLILDGQQRLTSLTQVLALDGPIHTFNQSDKKIKRYIYININEALRDPSSDDVFVILGEEKTRKSNFGQTVDLDLSTTEKEFEQFYFPCRQILNSDEWEEGLQQYDQDKFSSYMKFRKKILKAFREYQLPVISLDRSTTKEAVCLVFEKVNTAGKTLTVFELVTASFASEGFNLRDDWYGTQEEEGRRKKLRKSPLLKSILPSDFLQTVSLLHSFDNQNLPVSAKRADILKLKKADYEAWADKAEKGYQQAANFLEELCFISSGDLPYRTQVVPLAAVMAILGEGWREHSNKDKLRRWYWCGVFGELYGGAVETRIANDMQELLSWINNDDSELPRTIKESSFQISRLKSLRSRRSAAYKGISTYVLSKGARDFIYNADIKRLNEDGIGVDIHHIFPKSWCKRNSAEHSDTIVNKTPISAKSNRSIGGKAPSKYLDSVRNRTQLSDDKIDEILESHQISSEKIRADDYDAFFRMRMEKLSGLIEEAIGKKVERDIEL